MNEDAQAALQEGLRRAAHSKSGRIADNAVEVVEEALSERGFVIETKRDARRNIEVIRRELADMMRLGCPHMDLTLHDMNLPDAERSLVSNDVRLPLETMQGFRNHYEQLICFAAVVCGVKPSTLCAMDMAQALYEGIKPPGSFEELLEVLSVLDLGANYELKRA